MPSAVEVPEILGFIKQRLAEASDLVRLEVTDDEMEDDYLYVVVTPAAVGIRASDHADLMSKIEGEVERNGWQNVYLVPTIHE